MDYKTDAIGCEFEDAVVITPCDQAYDQARQGWNRAIQQYPCEIVYCTNAAQVSAAVCQARQQGRTLRVRSGGHNYQGYSNGDCTMVIDISGINHMELDERVGVLRVGAGVTNQQVYAFTGARGYAFPGGTCPTVGVSGYALGGGWGLSCRYLGLGCDSLLEVTLIDAQGRLVTASQAQNSGLFWACRGAGGGNFGVVVEMVFRLGPKVENVTLIELDYLHADSVRQQAFLRAWSDWLAHADNRMTLIGRVYRSPQDGEAMLLRGIFYGTPDQAQTMLQGFLTLQPTGVTLEYIPFLQAVHIIGSSYPAYERFSAVSGFAQAGNIAKHAPMLVGLITRQAKGAVFTGLSLYALGGQVAQTAVDETAFFYRNADSILWLQTVWEDETFAADNRCWLAQRAPLLASVTVGSYVNFPYGGLPCPLEQYYGLHAQHLREIKAQVDPCNVFSFPQGIFPQQAYTHAPLPQGEALHAQGGALDSLQSAADAMAGNYRGFRYVRAQGQ